jgi:hypothetical protein
MAQSGRAGSGCLDEVEVDLNVCADDDDVDDCRRRASINILCRASLGGKLLTIVEAASSPPGVRFPALLLPTLDVCDILRMPVFSLGPTTSLPWYGVEIDVPGP